VLEKERHDAEGSRGGSRGKHKSSGNKKNVPTYTWVLPAPSVGAEDASTLAKVVSVHWGQGVTGIWINPPPSERKE